MKGRPFGGSTSKVIASPGLRPPARRVKAVPTGPAGGTAATVPLRVTVCPEKWLLIRPQPEPSTSAIAPTAKTRGVIGQPSHRPDVLARNPAEHDRHLRSHHQPRVAGLLVV